MPFGAVVNPAVQVQLPLALQTPFTQLHDAGALASCRDSVRSRDAVVALLAATRTGSLVRKILGRIMNQ